MSAPGKYELEAALDLRAHGCGLVDAIAVDNTRTVWSRCGHLLILCGQDRNRPSRWERVRREIGVWS